MADNYLQFSVHIDCDNDEAQKLEDRLQEHNVTTDVDREGVLVYCDDTCDFEGVCDEVSTWLKAHDLLPVTITYAETCSHPRPGAFTGGAAVVHAGGVYYVDPLEGAEDYRRGLDK